MIGPRRWNYTSWDMETSNDLSIDRFQGILENLVHVEVSRHTNIDQVLLLKQLSGALTNDKQEITNKRLSIAKQIFVRSMLFMSSMFLSTLVPTILVR